MENPNKPNCDVRFAGFGEATRTGGCWTILLAIVLGGTQVLFAQHGQGSSAQQEKSSLQVAGQDSEQRPSSDTNEHWKAEPSCFEDATEMAKRGPVTRTWVLMSPDGRYGAYAVNESIATREVNGEISGCKSTSKLFVTETGHEKGKAVLVMEPAEGASGNSIELIDWSPVGHRLLVMEGFWPWASDAGGVEPRTYDADSGKLSNRGDFFQAFRGHMGRECVSLLLPVGFSASGKAVVRASPYADEEGTLEKDSCVRKVSLWLVDPVGFGIRRVGDSFKVQKYGKKGE